MDDELDEGPVVLTRDCEATMVPFGDRVALSEGGVVFVVQRLGGSITVRTEMGTLLRVDGADADALGMEATLDDAVHRAGPFGMDQVTAALHTVFDPEIPVSIVDLGLVYRCDEVIRPDGTRLIDIDLTMTAPGCGMGDVLRSDAERVVRSVPGVDAVDVHLVWDPPWGIDRMTDEVRLELGLM
jgi:probable FeS assembly SUF system protein SufT